MADLFIKILNMSISAGWLILLVVFLRLLFRKMPKWIRVLLWGIVGLRLLLPVSLESRLSLIPSTETIRYDAEGERTTVQTGIGALDRLIVLEESQSEHSGNTGNTGNDLVSESPDTVAKTNAMPLGECSVEPGKASLNWFQFLGILWMAGMLLMLGYALFSYLRLKRRVRESIPAGELTDTDCQRVRLCDRIDTPFILGVFRPMVYLPSGMDEDEIKLVLAHEGAHLRRRDHLWKPLGFLLLTVYWFNPLIGAAYILLCRDIEMACDEKVIREMEDAGKKAYAKALVSCSQHRRVVMACPLAFGEVGVKERIKGILNYKRPAFWVILLAIIACVVVAVCFLTNPAKKTEESSTETVESYEPYPGAVLKVLEASDTGCTLQLRNDGNKDFGIGKDEFGLEQLKDDSWVPVDPIVSERYSGLLEIAVSPGKETEFSVTWQYVYGSLPDGEYRIVFYACDEEHRLYPAGIVSDEFSINNEEARKKEAEEKQKQEEAASQQRERETEQKNKEKVIDPDAAWRGEGISLNSWEWTDPQIYDKEIPQLGLSMKLMDVSLECCTTVFSNYGNEETGDIEIDTGEAWYLQKKVDGKWARVRSNYETGVVEVGYSIPKGEVSRKMLDQWVALVGRLTPGEYRIMKFVITNRQVGGYRGFYIAQSFNVEENGSIYGDYYLENEDPFSSAASSSIDTFREYDNDGNLIVVKFGRNQKTVEIDYGSSVLYTKDEMSPLIEQIVNVLMFRAKDGLEVYAIRFTSDEECSKYDELKMLNEQGRAQTGNPKLTYKEYIKFETDMKEPDDWQKSSEPGMKHTGWGWWFAREEGGEWVLVGQGY